MLLSALAVIVPLLLMVAVLIAYVWQPPQQHDYRSAYLSRTAPQHVDTAVARFEYLQTGQGEPVVLVAGGGEWLYTYRDTAPALAQFSSVYTVDLPGQGYTVLKQSSFRFDLDAMSSALTDFLDALGIRRASLVGHSWGGMWVVAFADKHPERVDRLVLIDAPVLDVSSSLEWRAFEVPMLGEMIGKLMRRSDVEAMLRKSFAHQDRVTDEMVDEDWAALSRADNRKALWLSQRRLDHALTQTALVRLRAPTLVLWGSEDQFDPVTQAADIGRRIHHATVRVLGGCGHSAHEDCPDLANPELVRFLSQPP